MVRLKIREVAIEKGINLSRFQILCQLPMLTARRLWWSSATGARRDEGTLKAVRLDTLATAAEVLGVDVSELMERQQHTN